MESKAISTVTTPRHMEYSPMRDFVAQAIVDQYPSTQESHIHQQADEELRQEQFYCSMQQAQDDIESSMESMQIIQDLLSQNEVTLEDITEHFDPHAVEVMTQQLQMESISFEAKVTDWHPRKILKRLWYMTYQRFYRGVKWVIDNLRSEQGKIDKYRKQLGKLQKRLKSNGIVTDVVSTTEIQGYFYDNRDRPLKDINESLSYDLQMTNHVLFEYPEKISQTIGEFQKALSKADLSSTSKLNESVVDEIRKLGHPNQLFDEKYMKDQGYPLATYVGDPFTMSSNQSNRAHRSMMDKLKKNYEKVFGKSDISHNPNSLSYITRAPVVDVVSPFTWSGNVPIIDFAISNIPTFGNPALAGARFGLSVHNSLQSFAAPDYKVEYKDIETMLDHGQKYLTMSEEFLSKAEQQAKLLEQLNKDIENLGLDDLNDEEFKEPTNHILNYSTTLTSAFYTAPWHAVARSATVARGIFYFCKRAI